VLGVTFRPSTYLLASRARSYARAHAEKAASPGSAHKPVTGQSEDAAAGQGPVEFEAQLDPGLSSAIQRELLRSEL
jgi:hypothetical protein